MSSIRDKLRRLHRPRPTEAPRPSAGDEPIEGVGAVQRAAAASSPGVPPPVALDAPTVAEPPAGPVEPARGDAERASTLRTRLGRFAGLADPGESKPAPSAAESLFGDEPIAGSAEAPADVAGPPVHDERDSPGPRPEREPAGERNPRSGRNPRGSHRPPSEPPPREPFERPSRRRGGRLAPELFSRKRFEAWRERRVEGHLTMVPADRDTAEPRREPTARDSDPVGARGPGRHEPTSEPSPPTRAVEPVTSHTIDLPHAPCTHLSELTRGRFHRATGGGTCWVARDRVPLAARYGEVALGDALGVHAEHVVRASGDLSLGRFDVRDALFFDLETSGLSAAKGAVAWIIGFASIRGDDVLVEQIAMHDPVEERATLDAALSRIRSAGTLVSFNGASFDLRFLRHRLVHHGLPDAPLDRPHLDLLPTARRVWTKGVTNHRLATLDAEILGRPRGDDIPGAEAPRRWANYLRDGDVRPLVPLFEHNRLDLVGLVALLAAAATGRPPVGAVAAAQPARAPCGAVAAARPAATAWATAQLRLAEGDDVAAEPEIRAALASGLGGGDRRRALADLATLRERAGDAIDAVHFWQQLVDDGAPDATPHIQLARIWRDGLDRPDRALDHLRRAATLAPWDERLAARIRTVEREVASRGRN